MPRRRKFRSAVDTRQVRLRIRYNLRRAANRPCDRNDPHDRCRCADCEEEYWNTGNPVWDRLLFEAEIEIEHPAGDKKMAWSESGDDKYHVDTFLSSQFTLSEVREEARKCIPLCGHHHDKRTRSGAYKSRGTGSPDSSDCIQMTLSW